MKPHDRSVPPPTHGLSRLRLDVADEFVLPRSGMLANVVRGGSEDLHCVSMYVRGGTIMQPAPQVARLTSALTRRGTSRVTATQIAELLDYHGSWMSTSVTDFYTAHHLYSLGSHAQVTVPVLMSTLGDAALDEAEFEQHRTQVAMNLAVAARRARWLASRRMQQLYWGDGHPLALAASVSPDGVATLPHATICDYYRQCYRRANMRVVIAGTVSDRLIDIVDRAITEHIAVDAQPALSRPDTSRRGTATGVHIIDVPHAEQAAIVIAIPAVPRSHPDYIKLRILVMALGGYFGSRLMSNIREDKGYTYGINAYLAGRADDGHVAIETECNHDKVAEVLEAVNLELRRLREDLIDERELNVVKQHIMGELARTLDSPFAVASHVASRWQYGIDAHYFNRQVDEVQAITAATLRDVAERYLSEAPLVVVAANAAALDLPATIV